MKHYLEEKEAVLRALESGETVNPLLSADELEKRLKKTE